MEPYTERVISIIKSIPAGKVMTYGQIAMLAGNPRSARQVARILHSMSKTYSLPWHRVINAQGAISIKDPEGNRTQKEALEQEGIRVINGKIDLDQVLYIPE